jgi:hypothetical protein
MRSITRRGMLALLGAGVAGGVAAAVGRAFVEDTAAPVAAAPDPPASTEDRTPDRRPPIEATTPIGLVGAAYLALTPDEASRETLRELVPELAGVRRGEIEGRLGVLAERVREDFASGDTVVIDGWVLARTEARGAALVVAS